jgi:hypothetical protein
MANNASGGDQPKVQRCLGACLPPFDLGMDIIQ